MKFAACVFLLLTSALMAWAQSPVATIHIHVLNGRNGKAIAKADNATTVLPLGTFADAITSTTDGAGLETVYVPSASSLRVTVNHRTTCDAVSRKERKHGSEPASVQTIVATGLVSSDRCGGQAVTPTPGELTLYVRPWHWWQRFGY